MGYAVGVIGVIFLYESNDKSLYFEKYDSKQRFKIELLNSWCSKNVNLIQDQILMAVTRLFIDTK